MSPPTLADEFVVFFPLTELQESVYRALLECEDVQLILHAHEPCDCYSGETRGDCCYRVGHTATATVERRGGTAAIEQATLQLLQWRDEGGLLL